MGRVLGFLLAGLFLGAGMCGFVGFQLLEWKTAAQAETASRLYARDHARDRVHEELSEITGRICAARYLGRDPVLQKTLFMAMDYDERRRVLDPLTNVAGFQAGPPHVAGFESREKDLPSTAFVRCNNLIIRLNAE